MRVLLNEELVGWAGVVHIKTGKEDERELRERYFCWNHLELGG